MNIALDEKQLEHKTLIEQVKVLYQSMASLLAINLVVSASLVLGFWDVVPHQSLLIWLSLMLVMLAVRALFFYRYKKNYDPEKVHLYSRVLVLGSASAGFVWGLGGLLLFPVDHFDYQLFIVMSLLAMTAGSTFSLSIYLPAFFVFSPITLLPITVYHFWLGGAVNITLALVTLTFLGALTAFNIKINKNFKESFRLRFENLELVEQLEIQRNEAQRANIAKSRFLAAASHDLRQPLYALGLFTSVLEEMETTASVDEVIEQINASVYSLQDLFDSLLDISQLDAGGVDVEIDNFLVSEVFEDLKTNFSQQIADKNIQLRWPEDDYAICSDANLLNQILRNFLSNALNYTERGEIRLSCEADNGQLIIRVSDTGLGIALSEQQDIFDEFYQLGNPERDRSKGLGLGLSIVRRAANLLGSDITVESEVGQGSTFSIAVPLAVDFKPAITAPSSGSPSADFSEDMLVVVIDDEALIREGLEHLLTLWGCEVVTAASGDIALERLLATGKVPDAIVSDFQLANDELGVDVISAIHKAFNQDIPALLVTGEIDKDRIAAINSQNYQVLYKPVPPLKLRAFLRHIKAPGLSS